MAQITNRAQLATLLTQPLDDAFTNRGKKLKKIFPKFMQVKDPGERGQFIDYQFAKFGKLQLTPEETGTPYDQLEFNAAPFTVTFDSYSLGWRISREAMDDLGGGGYGAVETAQIASLAEITAAFQDASLATQEDLCAQLILLANSTTVTPKWIGPGRDTVALAGTHTLLKNGVGTFSNNMTAAALSYYQVLSGWTLMQTIPSDEGFYSAMPDSLDLVVGPYNAARAYDLQKSKGKPDSNENNPNLLSDDFKINVNVDPYLGPTFKGWALMDRNRHKCYYHDRQKPTLDKEADFETRRGMKYSVFMRGKVSFSSAHGFVFNAGA